MAGIAVPLDPRAPLARDDLGWAYTCQLAAYASQSLEAGPRGYGLLSSRAGRRVPRGGVGRRPPGATAPRRDRRRARRVRAHARRDGAFPTFAVASRPARRGLRDDHVLRDGELDGPARPPRRRALAGDGPLVVHVLARSASGRSSSASRRVTLVPATYVSGASSSSASRCSLGGRGLPLALDDVARERDERLGPSEPPEAPDRLRGVASPAGRAAGTPSSAT